MIRNLKVILIAVVLLLAGTIAIFSDYHASQTAFDYKPVEKSDPVLTQGEVETILGSQFHLIRRVRFVPLTVKQSFTNITGLPLDMANPGETLGSDDVVPGVPERRLVFAALSDHCAVLVFQQGGYVTTVHAVVFSYKQPGGSWGAGLTESVPHDMRALKSAISEGHFQQWGSERDSL